jgi:ssRNA-specific RNase YbeY (16S rRNA maturation enzyme)
VQVTIYHSNEDHYLLDLVDQQARRERKSRSAVILSILEEHYEREKKLGEILVDLRAISQSDVAKGLKLQKNTFTEKLLGEILIEQEVVEKEAVERALTIQGRFR